ncbi:MAG: choice-of-anchor R domain-containing protein [Candidatus Cybelea sp.]|jgi:hypothetical protein
MTWKTPVLALLTGAILSACGGRSITPAAQVAAPANYAHAKLVTIVSNLASYASGRYWAFEGSPVTGPEGQRGFPENWRAVAFSPSANHTATAVQVGVALSSGTNGLVLSLNRDDKGVPGKAIATAQLSDLPAFGTCCTIKAATLGKGVPLKAGTRYWVVVSTNSSELTTNATWMYNDTDQVDSFLEASYCPTNCGSASGWTPYQSDTVSGSELAYAVLGSN